MSSSNDPNKITLEKTLRIQSPCQMMIGVESPPKRKVFSLNETILSFGEPGSLRKRTLAHLGTLACC